MLIEKQCEPYLNSAEVIRIVHSNNDTFLHRVLDCIEASRQEICRNIITTHYLIDSDILRMCREDAFQNAQISFVQNVRNQLFSAERETCIPYLKTIFRKLYWREYQRELKRKLVMKAAQPPATPATGDEARDNMQEKVKRILLLLSEEDRKIYRLYYEEGYKIKDIAPLLHIDAASVSKKLLRLHKRFSGQWNED